MSIHAPLAQELPVAEAAGPPCFAIHAPWAGQREDGHGKAMQAVPLPDDRVVMAVQEGLGNKPEVEWHREPATPDARTVAVAGDKRVLLARDAALVAAGSTNLPAHAHGSGKPKRKSGTKIGMVGVKKWRALVEFTIISIIIQFLTS